MNNKGQLAYLMLSIVSGIIIFMAGMYLMNPIIDSVIDSKTNLNCASASTISDGNKLLCLVVDSAVPYFIMIVIAVSSSIFINKMLGEGVVQ